MEKLDEIKARYTELVYQSVMSADTVTSEINEAVRLLIERDNENWREKYTQAENECKELRTAEKFCRYREAMINVRAAKIMGNYTYKKPTTIWEHIKGLFTNKKVQHVGLVENTEYARGQEKSHH